MTADTQRRVDDGGGDDGGDGPDQSPPRSQAIRAIIDQVLERESVGERFTDAALIADHADLMPELAEQLRLLRMVQRAASESNSDFSGIPISCPDCHAENWISDDSNLSRLSCVGCGNQFRLVDDEESSDLRPSAMLGRFQLQSRLGAGAFGSVWQALDTKLNRQVALKIPLRGQERAEEVQRLVREARLAAQLHHPHIVAVHEVGIESDLVFIVTDLIRGVDLRKWLQKQRPSQREAAAICADLADALDHAHSRGIIHRDIKPSNVMVDEQRRVYVTDFGLAKRQSGEMTMTVTGKLLGTPDYMPPELVRSGAQDADARSDLYSLGVVLFEMLTGERPFRGDTRMVLHQTLTCDPPSPRRMNPRIHRDLDTICLKCLEKEPRNRYQTAGELHAELDRYLAGKSIAARPLSPIGRTWRWCQRNVLVASLLFLLASSVLGTAIIASVAAVRIQHHRALAVREAAYLALDRGLSLCETGEVATGLLWMGKSLDLASRYDTQLDRVVRANLAGWSQRVAPLVATTSQSQAISGLRFSADGSRYLSASEDGTVMVCEAQSGRILSTLKHADAVRDAKFSHDGKLIATASKDHTARLWDAASGRPISPPLQHTESVSSVDFSSDDRQLLTGSVDQQARIWDVATGALSGPPLHHTTAIFAAWFVPRSTPAKLVTVGGNQVLTWDVASRKEVTARCEVSQSIQSAVFSQDGQHLLMGTGTSDPPAGEAHLWDVTAGRPSMPPRKFSSIVSCVAISPDDATALVGTQAGQLLCWDRAQGTILRDDRPHEYEIRSAVFSPDSKRVVTGSLDGTARIWNMDDNQQLGVNLTHEHHVWSMAFAPRGTTLLTGGFNGIARLWDLAGIQPQIERLRERVVAAREPWSMRAQFSPSGAWVVTGNQNGEAILWSALSREKIATLQHPTKITALACTVDDQHLAVGCHDGSIRFWHVAEQRLLDTGHHGGEVTEIVASADGRWFLSASYDGEARLWEASTGKLMGEPWKHPAAVWYAAFQSDRNMALTSCGDGIVRLWSLPAGKPLPTELRHPYTAWEARFDRAGERVLTGCGPSAGSYGQAQWWEIETGKKLGRPMQHFGAVASVALSPDETLVATASFDGTAQLWDAESCEPVHEPLRHQGRVWTVAFSPDGKVLLTCSDDHTAQLWDVATGKPLGPSLVHPVPVRNVDIAANYQVVTGGLDDQARMWRMPAPWQAAEPELQQRIAHLTGMRLTGAGVAVSQQRAQVRTP